MDRSPSFPVDADSQMREEPIVSLHRAAFRAAITASDAYHATRAAVRWEGEVLRLGNRFLRSPNFREVAFLSAGHAAGSQALAVHHALGERITQGFTVGPLAAPAEVPFRSATVPPGWPGGSAGQAAAHDALELASGLGARDLLLVLLSGGALGSLALPPPGASGEEYGQWLATLYAAGERSRTVALAAAALGAGGVDGALARSTRGATVVPVAIDRGDGAGLVGGSPTRALGSTDRAEARAALSRAGLLDRLPPSVRTGIDRDPLRSEGQLPSVDRVIAAAQPSDALRGAADALIERQYRGRLAALGLEGGPAEAADRFVERLEALRAEALPPPGSRDRGLAVLATATLDVPEGLEPTGPAGRFLDALAPRLRGGSITVGAYVTSGGIGARATAGRIVGGASDPAIGRIDMREGITDVGTILVAIAPTPPRAERPSGPTPIGTSGRGPSGRSGA